MDTLHENTGTMSPCNMCPRNCAAARSAGKLGICSVGEKILVNRAAPHFGEEPCISGERGSGTVFFSGCNLRCVFCQNHEISRAETGKAVSEDELCDILLRLQDDGVHNINLVTPTHYTRQLVRVLEKAKLKIPVAWNSSAYESVEQLRRLEGLVQIYMPDYKFADASLAQRYCAAPDYPQAALAAIKEMYRQRGAFRLDDDGMMQSGVLIRHLIMPGSAENTLRVIDAIEDNFPSDGIIFSLMSQYTPMPGLEKFPELQRTVSADEYDRCASYFDFSDIEYGFTQSIESATEEMIPDFDGTGV
ncbi:MAG: radical SAM protein [Oscillospiraceae bacterium]|nr:radical SAM protein [Oscillospiraceae bacterium]